MKSKKISLFVAESMNEWLDAQVDGMNGKRVKGRILTAAVFMYSQASPEERLRYYRAVIQADTEDRELSLPEDEPAGGGGPMNADLGDIGRGGRKPKSRPNRA